MLEYNELEILIEEITEKITREIIMANRTGNLNEVLKKYGLDESITSDENLLLNMNKAKILLIGNTETKVSDLMKAAKYMGIDAEKIEYFLDYEKITNFNFGKLRYSTVYSDILVGPIPHKVKGIEENSSLIVMIESNQEEFPKLTKVMSEGELKISKNSFQKALQNTRLYRDLIA